MESVVFKMSKNCKNYVIKKIIFLLILVIFLASIFVGFYFLIKNFSPRPVEPAPFNEPPVEVEII